jgi:ATP-dependent DNA ligase
MIYYYPNRPILISPDSSLVKRLSDDDDWFAEIKYNGDRLCLQLIDKKFHFFNRHKQLLKYQPSKELSDQLYSLNLPNNSQFDGELMHFHTKNIKDTIYFYDIYYLNGEDVEERLEVRKEILYSFIKKPLPNISVTKEFKKDFVKVFNKVTKVAEQEGLVMKNRNGLIKFTTNKSYDVDWQYKIRKENKNYAF